MPTKTLLPLLIALTACASRAEEPSRAFYQRVLQNADSVITEQVPSDIAENIRKSTGSQSPSLMWSGQMLKRFPGEKLCGLIVIRTGVPDAITKKGERIGFVSASTLNICEDGTPYVSP